MSDFRQLVVKEPEIDVLQSQYAQLLVDLDEQGTPEIWGKTLASWDSIRRSIDTWRIVTEIRFHQDTKNVDYKSAMDRRDEIDPKLTDLDVQVKKKLLSPKIAQWIDTQFGSQATSLWKCQVRSFDPKIENDLVEEAKLVSRYNELLAGAELAFNGETTNLSGILKYTESPDRETRYQAMKTQWGWFGQNRDELDEIFDKMVKLRHQMATDLGLSNFVELGYLRMTRVDYDQNDVAGYREMVREQIVPLAKQIKKRQAEQIGIDEVMFWDESVYDKQGNPKPKGSYDEQIDQAQKMFDAMHPKLGEFFKQMNDRHLMDLQNRPRKAGGGFCAEVYNENMPFIFANFNGTKGDVEVFTHEMGHAYQMFASMPLSLIELVMPTFEACEIHSMGLEYLCWPYMNQFFGDQADRFRQIHLTEGLLHLPYGVAVDHFQHLAYSEPNATAQDRHAMWKEVESLYLPNTQYGDLPHLPIGGRWQQKRHIYMCPFYYVDYTLAQCCALQFWARSQTSYEQSIADFMELCHRGGSLPFQQLTRSAGLKSPFEPGSLATVVQSAREFLKI